MEQLFDGKKEGKTLHEKFETIKKNNQNLKIFKRIMSSPYDDLMYAGGQESAKHGPLNRGSSLEDHEL